jgi:hypothetical protein
MAKPFTPERIRQVEAAAGVGCSDEEIANILGFDPTLLARPKLRKAVDKARANTTQQVAAALIRKALAGNIPAAVFYLKAKSGWRDTDAALEREQEEKQRRVPRILVIDEYQADVPTPPPVAAAG